jgi:membrane-associated protein
MMEAITSFVDFFLHLDLHLKEMIASYGTGTYLILFLIIFAETGLVVMPILPGDSLLFAAGTFAGMGDLKFWILLLVLCGAAILGDTVNYWIGKYAGDWILHRSKRRWIQKRYLDRTHEFFERYGGKTIILARFVPIVRTFAPFVAGIGAMTYGKFIIYNVVGGILWVGICMGAGYLFGGMPIVQNNFSLVILGIVFVSILPGVIEFIRVKRGAKGMPVHGIEPAFPSRVEGSK